MADALPRGATSGRTLRSRGGGGRGSGGRSCVVSVRGRSFVLLDELFSL